MAAWGGAIGLSFIGLSDNSGCCRKSGEDPIIHVRGRHQLLFLGIAGDDVGHGKPGNVDMDIPH